MAMYRNTTTGEVRDLDPDLIAAWQAAGNPKAQQWEPYTPPPPELVPPAPQWLAFGATLQADAGINALLTAALAAAPALAMGLSIGLGKAADGDDRVFLQSWQQAQQLGLITTTLATFIHQQAIAHDLPEEFIQAVAP